MKVELSVKACSVTFNGCSVPGIELDCERCGHTVKVGGEKINSYRRGCATMKDECPKGESNFYTCPDEPDE